LGTGDTFAFGINNADQIVGYYVNATGSHGFLYDHQPEAQHPKSFSYPQERRPITPSLPPILTVKADTELVDRRCHRL
jgi:hypothetical protein